MLRSEIPKIFKTGRMCKNFYNLNVEHKLFFLHFFNNFKKRRQFFFNRFKPFVYRINVLKSQFNFKRWKKRFVSLRIVKFYYSILSIRHFRKISRSAKRKSGLYESNYVLFLEGRLINFLYRTGFVGDIFKSLYIIRGGFVSINNVVKTFANQIVKMFDIVTFSPVLRIELYLNYFLRLHRWLVLHPPIRCIYFSFIFLFTFFFRAPSKKDIPNRKSVNIYRLTSRVKLY